MLLMGTTSLLTKGGTALGMPRNDYFTLVNDNFKVLIGFCRGLEFYNILRNHHQHNQTPPDAVRMPTKP